MTDQEMKLIRELLEEKIDGLEKNTSLRFDSLDMALKLAAKTADEKYNNLNKLKEEVAKDKEKFALKDDVKRELQIIKDEVKKDFLVVLERIAELKEFKTKTESIRVEKLETRTQSNWSTGLTIVTILSSISLVMMVIHLFRG